MNNHIILIGFKHVGKSTIGKSLSIELLLPFIDLDREIEARHKEQHGAHISCRELFRQIGSDAFRALEHEVLSDVLARQESSIVSLGGGTPITMLNQELLKGRTILHITSQKESVYERIMLSGKPAFLSPDENTYESFARVWNERMPIYQSLATHTIENNSSPSEIVQKIKQLL